jgi:2,4-dienoyl-CoA reductase-like NADH-dependent reductase (Old Yellow Enzyme family)
LSAVSLCAIALSCRGAVGLIKEPKMADEIITQGCADLVFLARELLRDPYWALKAQQDLHVEPAWPIQYG